MNLNDGDFSLKKYFDLGNVMSAFFPELEAGSGPIFERLNVDRVTWKEVICTNVGNAGRS